MNWVDYDEISTYSAYITKTLNESITISAMPSAYFDEIMQKLQQNQPVYLMLTYTENAYNNIDVYNYTLQAHTHVNSTSYSTTSSKYIEFDALAKYLDKQQNIKVVAHENYAWTFSIEPLATDGNFVSAGNNQQLTMITANNIPSQLSNNTIYII